MPDVDTRLLRSFLSVTAERSFSRAAARLGCSQATMSLRIRSLEDHLGVALFERHYHDITLTQAGRELLPRAQDLVDRHDVLLDQVHQGQVSGTVRIGLAEDYALPMLPRFLSRLRQSYPRIEPTIVSALSRELCQQVDARSLDLAVVTLPEATPDAAVLSNPALEWVASPDFERGDGQPWPMAFYPEGCAFRQAAESALTAHGVPYREALKSASGQVIRSAVASGTAITVMAAGTIPEDLVTVPVKRGLPELPNSCIQIVERREGLSRAAQQVKELFVRAF